MTQALRLSLEERLKPQASKWLEMEACWGSSVPQKQCDAAAHLAGGCWVVLGQPHPWPSTLLSSPTSPPSPQEKERQRLENLRRKEEAEQLRRQKVEEDKRRWLEEVKL